MIKNKKIIVIDNSNLAYSGEDINGTFLRGTETSLILLSEFLVKRGFSVDYCNCIKDNKTYKGVNYLNKNLGVKSFLEVGPKNVLSGLIKRIVPDCQVSNFGEKADLDKI